ncbi:hypothetical protein [Enhygromyxa salina]|nr:hypothetical protein [Enhygromyxa salina]
MRTHRRGWTPPIPLTLVTALAVVSPLGLSGCQKVKELTGQTDESSDEDETEDKTSEDPAADAPDQAAVELETAKEAGLAEAALAPPPVAGPMTGLDDLLALVPKQDGDIKGVVVVRDASVFLDYIDEGSNFVAGPLTRLGAAAKGNPALSELASAGMVYPMIKGQYEAAKITLAASGIHLDKGIVVADDAQGNGVIIYAGDKPDALPSLIKAIDDSGPEMSCKNIDGHAGYVVCTEEKADLEAYAPAGPEGAAAIRARLATNLPGVDFEASNIIMDIAEEDLHLTIETPPGLMVMSLAPPQNEPEMQEMAQTFTPSAGKLLRGVQPGAGFIWGNVSPQLVADEMVADIANDPGAPQSVKDLAGQLTGEFLLAGHYQPAAVALQVGLKDDGSWPAVAGELEAVMPGVKEGMSQELDIPGATWDVGIIDIPVGAETVKALHAGLSGVPEADVLAQMTGLTIDGWVFAASDALHIALGASPEAIGQLPAAPGEEGPSDGLRAYLPGSLMSALDANQVSMVAHMPLDALHSPQTRELIKTALKNVEDVDADLVLAMFDLASPLSNGTMWLTHSGGKTQIHMALQAFGHRADDEGKAALAAAAAVASGADPTASYSPLVAQYPNSARLAAYRARAGQTQAALVASGVGALVAAGALAYPVLEGARNEEISEELDIEEDAAEKAKEESKQDPTPTPTPTPADDTKDETDNTEPEPTPDPTPIIPVPSGDEGDEGDDGAPTPPPIIPKKIPRKRN